MTGDPDLYYDRDGQPITHDQWRALRSNDEYVRIALDYTADARIWVSTVWLGLDESWNKHGPPQIYETMIYPAREQCSHYATEKQARAGHAEVCRALRGGEKYSTAE